MPGRLDQATLAEVNECDAAIESGTVQEHDYLTPHTDAPAARTGVGPGRGGHGRVRERGQLRRSRWANRCMPAMIRY